MASTHTSNGPEQAEKTMYRFLCKPIGLCLAGLGPKGGAITTEPDATPPAICQNLGGGGSWGGGGSLEGLGGGGWLEGGGGGGSQVGGAYTQPTTSTCIPLGGMCVSGGFEEAAGGGCEARATDWQMCPW